MQVYFYMLMIICTLMHYVQCYGMEEKKSYTTTNDLIEKYKGHHPAFFVHLAELCAKQNDRYDFFAAIKKKSYNCLAYLINLANKIGANDLSKQIECYFYIKHAPLDIQPKFYDNLDREKIAKILSSKVLTLKHTQTAQFANKEKLLYLTHENLLFTTNRKGDFSIYSKDMIPIKQFAHANPDMNNNADKGHEDSVYYARILDKTNHMISQGKDGYIKLWDLEKNICIKNIAHNVQYLLFDVLIKGEEKLLIYVEDEWLKGWPLDIEKEPYYIAHLGPSMQQISIIDHLNKIICIQNNGVAYSCALDGTINTNKMLMPTYCTKNILLDFEKKNLRTYGSNCFSIWSTKKEACKGTIICDFCIEGVIPYRYKDTTTNSLCKRQILYNRQNVWVCDTAHNEVKYKIPLPVSPIKEVKIVPETSYCFMRDDNEIVMYDTHQNSAMKTFKLGTCFIKSMKSYKDDYLTLLMCTLHNNNDHGNNVYVYDYMNDNTIITSLRHCDKIKTINRNESVYALIASGEYGMHNIELMKASDAETIHNLTSCRPLKEAFFIEKFCFDKIENIKKIPINESQELLNDSEYTFLKKCYSK